MRNAFDIFLVALLFPIYLFGENENRIPVPPSRSFNTEHDAGPHEMHEANNFLYSSYERGHDPYLTTEEMANIALRNGEDTTGIALKDGASIAFLRPFEKIYQPSEAREDGLKEDENYVFSKWESHSPQDDFSMFFRFAAKSIFQTDMPSTDSPWTQLVDDYDWGAQDSAGTDAGAVSRNYGTVVPECRLEAFDFESKRKIGKGGQATAYLITLRLNPLKKFIWKSYSKQVEFDRELQVAQIKDPFIIAIVCVSRDKLSMMMPFADGGDLWKGFPRSSSECSYELVTSFAAQLILAIEKLHSYGLLHHDIKPHNLVRFLKRNRIALIDFGLSVPTSMAGYRRGTRITMAPEVAQVKGYNGVPLHQGLDWWSVGVTIYMLHRTIDFCKEFPVDEGDFTRKSRISSYLPYTLTMAPKKKGVFESSILWNPIPPTFSPDLLSLLKRLLHPDPNQRQFNTVEKIGRLKAHRYFANVDWARL